MMEFTQFLMKRHWSLSLVGSETLIQVLMATRTYGLRGLDVLCDL